MSEYDSGIVMLIDKEADKRERFAQTYIVFFGLLLSYDQVSLLQEVSMLFFLMFLFAIFLYYFLLDTRLAMLLVIKTFGVKCFIYLVNLTAFLCSYHLSVVVVVFFLIVWNGSSSLNTNNFVLFAGILLLSIFFSFPLLIRRSMFR